MRQLRCQPLDFETFAPFGSVIDANAREPEIINDGSTQRYPELARLDLRAPERDPVLCIYVARARHFPLPIARLERHRQAAQVFVPLGPHRFVVIVAAGGEAPDWSSVKAFLRRDVFLVAALRSEPFRSYARTITPLPFAVCVAIKSMSGGDRQS